MVSNRFKIYIIHFKADKQDQIIPWKYINLKFRLICIMLIMYVNLKFRLFENQFYAFNDIEN